MAIVKKFNNKDKVIAEKNIIDHNQLANRDQYGAHSISSIRKLPEKITALKDKDAELTQAIIDENLRAVERENQIETKAQGIDLVDNQDSTLTFTDYDGEQSIIKAGHLVDNSTIQEINNGSTLEVIGVTGTFEKEIDGQQTEITELYDAEDIYDDIQSAKGIDLVQETDSDVFTGRLIFTDYDGQQHTLRSGFLPDDDTITLKNNLLGIKKVYVDSDTIVGDGSSNATKLNAKAIKDANGTITVSQINEMNNALQAVEGKGGYLVPYDFDSEAPNLPLDDLVDHTYSALTEYALQQIGILDPIEIFNGTKINNLYNNHTWILNNTQDTDPAIFEWVDLGAYRISIATNNTLGVVKGSPEELEASVDLNGVITINGLEQALNDLDTNKQDVMQVESMPNADVDYLNKVFQYIGTTQGAYVNSYFYRCILDSNDNLYKWVRVDTQPSTWGNIGGTLSDQTDLQQALNSKQDNLVSGTNIKTINNGSILGPGNINLVNDVTINGTSIVGADNSAAIIVDSTVIEDSTNPVSGGAVFDELATKQDNLVNQVNIKSLNNNSILGSGNLQLNTYHPFPASWTTDSTIDVLLNDVENDSLATVGMVYLGDVTCSDLPFNGNAELRIEVIDGSGTSKTLVATLTSGNVAPYYWQYTYWVNGGIVHTSGWKSFLSSTTKYAANLSVNGTTVQLKDQDGNDIGNSITTQDTGATVSAIASDLYQYNNYTTFTTTSEYIGFLVGVSDGVDITYTEVTNANKDSLNITPGTTIAYKYGNAGTNLSYNSSNRTMTLNRNKVFVELNDIDNALSATSRNPIQNKIIAQLIPSGTSAGNQLVNVDTMNSSIGTNTANFIGTFENMSLLLAYSGTLTNNDYAFVMNSVITDNGNDWASITDLNNFNKALLTNFDYAWVINGAKFDLYRFDIVNQVWDLRVSNTDKADITLNNAYNRYKYNGTTASWIYEFTLNNSSFTAAQWAAVNSGMTSADKTKLDGIESGAQVNTVTSVNNQVGAVVLDADDISDVSTTNKFVSANDISTWNAKQDAIDSSHKLSADLVDDTTATNKFVTSTDISTWNAKQNAIDSSNKLDSDLIDDTNSTNKFVTASDKQTWNAKQDALPTTSTANQVLKSTSTSGTTQWGTLSASDVGALADSTKYGASLDISGTSLQLKDQDGNNLGSAVTTQDTGATSVGLHSGDTGNVITDMSYDNTSRKITFEKGITALTSHQSIKKLDTTATTAQSTSASEDIAGSGTITLHKVSKTGSFSDLLNQPTLGTAAACNTGTAVGNVPVLDSNGKLDTSILPALAITNTFVESSQADMLALTAEVGDVCVRTDLNKSFILQAEPASTLTNWQELLTPADSVSSVNGKTGVVLLDADDISDTSTTNKFVTSTEKSTWSGKQDALPTSSTAGQVLKSTSTAGTTEWGTLSASDVGALPSNTTYVSSVNGSSGAITGLETTSNLVTNIDNNSTDTQYASAKCIFNEIQNAKNIEFLYGTNAKPINFATDMEVGKLYSCSGRVTLTANNYVDLGLYSVLVFKRKSDTIVSLFGFFGTSSPTSGQSINSLGYNTIGITTGYISSSNNYSLGAVRQVNGVGSSSGTSIYAPTSAGTSGYLLESKGSSNAPTFTIEKSTTISNNSTNSQVPSAKAVYDNFKNNVENPNLISNNAFEFNSHGETVYGDPDNTTTQYPTAIESVDGWYFSRDYNGTFNANTKVLQVGSAGSFAILYTATNLQANKYEGKTFTLSISAVGDSSSSLFYGIGYGDKTNNVGYTNITQGANTGSGIFTISGTIPENLSDSQVIKIRLYKNSGNATLNWVKLEVGSINTAYTPSINEEIINKVTSIDANSTNDQYPSAKAVFNYIASLNATQEAY